MLKQYIRNIFDTEQHGDAREESFYSSLEKLIESYAGEKKLKNIHVTTLPKKTDGGNPDFRVWDGKQKIIGYIEAKKPGTDLRDVEDTEQIQRYLATFPNVLLTNFYEFRLYRDGKLINYVQIARSFISKKLKTPPPVEKVDEFNTLIDQFLSFSFSKKLNAQSLAVELAKRTRFMDIIVKELLLEDKDNTTKLSGFYKAFSDYLLTNLTKQQFADLYSQTITYGMFAARTRTQGTFTRETAFNNIPNTIGILRDIFRYISLEEPPKQIEWIVDDIAEILSVTNTQELLEAYYREGKGRDPIIHFYETFLANYDPEIRERRGVYYTIEPVVIYIIRAIHSILKSHFGLADGLADENVKLLDPAGGTLTFPAEAIRVAAEEYKEKYGEGGLHGWIKKHILANFFAFELMMAPYAIGHLKMGFILDELNYKLSDDERFKLYLTNTLEMEEIQQIHIPGVSSLSEESRLAGKVKKEQPVLVVTGNPPYSGISSNINEWTERLLKEDLDGLQSYYKVDDEPLGEKKVWLQDDYVKFLRFAQWKIQKSRYGIVGMITNHSYLDNPTFRGMRQSLMKTFDEIYILDLHGNSLKKEKTPEGGKDENVFDIRQGVAIALFIRNKQRKKSQVFHTDLFGLRDKKYKWLEVNKFKKTRYRKIEPESPWYFFIQRKTRHIKQFLTWNRIDEIFTFNINGIVTARDRFVIGFEERELRGRINQFRNLTLSDDIIRQTFGLKDTRGWKLSSARKKLADDLNWDSYYKNILYRPFDARKIYYTDTMIDWGRQEYMYHMFKKNIALIMPRRVETKIPWRHCLCTDIMIEHVTVSSKTVDYLFPLYLYPDDENHNPKRKSVVMALFEPEMMYKKRRPNINEDLFKKFVSVYGTKTEPEEIFYYTYSVLYSNIYREKYAEFLKIDFPRIPFPADKKLFRKLTRLGNELAELHLLKSPALKTPIAKYQGTGTHDRIEKVIYVEKEQRVYINKEKYFEGIHPEIWNYQIGGYQILNKYLKDRKGRLMDDPPHYCRIVTALSKTMEIQKKIDQIYPALEESIIEFE